jgi:hypothetical protein
MVNSLLTYDVQLTFQMRVFPHNFEFRGCAVFLNVTHDNTHFFFFFGGGGGGGVDDQYLETQI